MTNISLSHVRAATYIPDPIHDKFSITVFERDFIDSIYFQRLHFILQTSTNFTSFPSNKSTRFPHSLGVSHIAGRIFSKATSNANVSDLREFIKTASSFIELVVKEFDDSFTKSDDSFENLRSAHFDTISGSSGFFHSPLEPDDTGERIDTEDDDNGNNQFSAAFIIDTFWQAIRLYALMHDLGHLPMSHAFERGLETTEEILKHNEADQKTQNEFIAAMTRLRQNFTGFDLGGSEEKFFTIFKNVLSFDNWTVPIEKIINDISETDIHEVRGLHIFNRYIRTPRDIAPNKPRNRDSNFSTHINQYARLINIITVFIIFSKAIKKRENGIPQEKQDVHPFAFLYSLKKIVDGEIDADRLDYTLRDCHEAGAQFGDFDLESIVNHAVLFKEPDRPVFVFGYSHQAVPGIEQFYETRYQSYKYVINHRVSARSNRCMEAAIAQIYAIACMDKGGKVSQTLQQYGFLSENGKSSEITLLPDTLNLTSSSEQDSKTKKSTKSSIFDKELLNYRGNLIDDFSFRSMCQQILLFIRQEYGTQTSKKGNQVVELMHLQLASLLEIVLFRANDNVKTLFKSQTMKQFITTLSKSQNIPEEKTKSIVSAIVGTRGIDDNIKKNIHELCLNMSNKYNIDFGVYLHYIKSKVFGNDTNEDFMEDRAFIKGSNPELESIIDHSSSLGRMSERAEKDLQIRIYVVSKDIKQNTAAVEDIENGVQEILQSSLRELIKESK